MLGTIKMPRDLSLLGGRLPKAQYSETEPTAKITEKPPQPVEAKKPPVSSRKPPLASYAQRADKANDLVEY